jgi:hypothetical protein
MIIHWTRVIGFLMENAETEALAALNRLYIARPNEIVVIFTRFIKCVQENSISYFDMLLMLQKLTVNFGSLRGNKHAETLIQTVSEPFSRKTNLKIIFISYLVRPAGTNITAVLSDQTFSP